MSEYPKILVKKFFPEITVGAPDDEADRRADGYVSPGEVPADGPPADEAAAPVVEDAAAADVPPDDESAAKASKKKK